MIEAPKFHNDIIKQAIQDALIPQISIEEEWIIEALCLIGNAYSSLKVKHSDQLDSFNEVELNTLLQMQILTDLKKEVNQRRKIDFVIKGQEFPNQDATKLEKRPDLTFFLRTIPYFTLIFGEAKILDKKNNKTIARYCTDGISRFVDGDYAWINSDAIMIAYVRDGSTINPALKEYLKLESNSKLFKVIGFPVSVSVVTGDVSTTQHQRVFDPIESHGITSSQIKLWHIWLT